MRIIRGSADVRLGDLVEFRSSRNHTARGRVVDIGASKLTLELDGGGRLTRTYVWRGAHKFIGLDDYDLWSEQRPASAWRLRKGRLSIPVEELVTRPEQALAALREQAAWLARRPA